MMEAENTSETSVDNYLTRQYIPEDKSELHTRRRENLKSLLLHSSLPTRKYQVGINKKHSHSLKKSQKHNHLVR
jgi:hypothetical protein